MFWCVLSLYIFTSSAIFWRAVWACTANRFPTVQITVQYRRITVLLFGRYSLRLDNKLPYKLLIWACPVAHFGCPLFKSWLRAWPWLIIPVPFTPESSNPRMQLNFKIALNQAITVVKTEMPHHQSKHNVDLHGLKSCSSPSFFQVLFTKCWRCIQNCSDLPYIYFIELNDCQLLFRRNRTQSQESGGNLA